jgi:hypothetical protein
MFISMLLTLQLECNFSDFSWQLCLRWWCWLVSTPYRLISSDVSEERFASVPSGWLNLFYRYSAVFTREMRLSRFVLEILWKLCIMCERKFIYSSRKVTMWKICPYSPIRVMCVNLWEYGLYLFVAHRLFPVPLENGCRCDVLVFCDIPVWNVRLVM